MGVGSCVLPMFGEPLRRACEVRDAEGGECFGWVGVEAVCAGIVEGEKAASPRTNCKGADSNSRPSSKAAERIS